MVVSNRDVERLFVVHGVDPKDGAITYAELSQAVAASTKAFRRKSMVAEGAVEVTFSPSNNSKSDGMSGLSITDLHKLDAGTDPASPLPDILETIQQSDAVYETLPDRQSSEMQKQEQQKEGFPDPLSTVALETELDDLHTELAEAREQAALLEIENLKLKVLATHTETSSYERIKEAHDETTRAADLLRDERTAATEAARIASANETALRAKLESLERDNNALAETVESNSKHEAQDLREIRLLETVALNDERANGLELKLERTQKAVEKLAVNLMNRDADIAVLSREVAKATEKAAEAVEAAHLITLEAPEDLISTYKATTNQLEQISLLKKNTAAVNDEVAAAVTTAVALRKEALIAQAELTKSTAVASALQITVGSLEAQLDRRIAENEPKTDDTEKYFEDDSSAPSNDSVLAAQIDALATTLVADRTQIKKNEIDALGRDITAAAQGAWAAAAAAEQAAAAAKAVSTTQVAMPALHNPVIAVQEVGTTYDKPLEHRLADDSPTAAVDGLERDELALFSLGLRDEILELQATVEKQEEERDMAVAELIGTQNSLSALYTYTNEQSLELASFKAAQDGSNFHSDKRSTASNITQTVSNNAENTSHFCGKRWKCLILESPATLVAGIAGLHCLVNISRGINLYDPKSSQIFARWPLHLIVRYGTEASILSLEIRGPSKGVIYLGFQDQVAAVTAFRALCNLDTEAA